ncbi:MAG: hypothetical protein BWK75_00235 [Candidatus Altiarchaeales archaeon A3]|nr:MAG: hypothetical protein BWK75_00235 [Candidatus Altiarchaeales archaeon A3]
MEIHPKTLQIFEILSKGQIISYNSSNSEIRGLYSIIESEENYNHLYEYFKGIGFVLEKGDEYFYFSRQESKVNLERKIEMAYKWIDIIDFFKTYDSAFGDGYRFTPSDILSKVNVDAELESKLEGLKKYTGKENYSEIIDKILAMLVNDTFIELENEITRQYKVLSSFKYLEQLVLTINIHPIEDINPTKNEILK